MTNADVHEELLRLRRQVDELAAARRKHQAAGKREEEDAATDAGDGAQAEHTIREQIEELTRLLQDEIRDMPALPTLAVFMLGVLIGRYLR